ncbi:hypothetical protein ACI78Q_13905, partial [Geodermatophilus sp. SYSU D00705]
MSTHSDDDGVVDPWVVLRRLMAENRTLRQRQEALQERLLSLEEELRTLRSEAVPTFAGLPAPESPPAPLDAADAPRIGPPRRTVDPAAVERPDASDENDETLPDIASLLDAGQKAAIEQWTTEGQRGAIRAEGPADRILIGAVAARQALLEGSQVVVVTPTVAVHASWLNRLSELLPGIDVGQLGGGRSDDLDDCHVLVATVSALVGVALDLRPGDLVVTDDWDRYNADPTVHHLIETFDRRLSLISGSITRAVGATSTGRTPSPASGGDGRGAAEEPDALGASPEGSDIATASPEAPAHATAAKGKPSITPSPGTGEGAVLTAVATDDSAVAVVDGGEGLKL